MGKAFPTKRLLDSHVFYTCQFEISSLRITACSPALATALGDTSPKGWIGNYVINMFSPCSFKNIEHLIGHPTSSKGCYCRLADQEATHPSVVVTIDLDKEGSNKGIATMICMPIENQGDLVEDLRKEVVIKDKQMEDLSDLTRLVIHDIKGVLQVILGSLELIQLKDSTLSFDTQKDLWRIERTTQNMNLMLTEISKYTRYDIGDYPPELTDLNTLVDSIILDFEDVPRKSVSIQRITDFPNLICEKALIRELFQNLVENAVMYSDKEKTKVEIGTAVQGEALYFFVRDNGVGIRKSDLDSVFSLLKRADIQQLNPHGTGMGLPQVKKIVQRHQGKIWLESIVGVGTTVWFNLVGIQH